MQPVAPPAIFFGTTYQLYWVEGVKPVALYVAAVTLVEGVDGAVAPVHKYRS